MSAPTPTPSRLPVALLWGGAALLCVAFGLMTVSHAFTLRAGEEAVWNQLMGWLVTADYSTGPRSIHTLQEAAGRPYQQELGAMSWHMGMGGALLILGLFQFVPVLRRRALRLHRATGVLFALVCTASMTGALWYLAHTTPTLVYSGPAFFYALVALGLSTLLTLVLALLALRARDYRAHMGWMALTYGQILSAPALRIAYVLGGHAMPMTLEEVNLGTSNMVVAFGVLPMALWMATIGAREFPARRAPGTLPAPLVLALAGLGTALALHEGVLVPLGLDLLAAVRAPAWALPLSALPWGLAAAGAALTLPQSLRAADRGQGPGRLALVLLVLAGLGELLIALLHHPAGALADVVQPLLWGGHALFLLILAALAATEGRRPGRAPWTVQVQYALLAPVLGPVLGLPLMAAGLSFSEAMTAGFILGCGGLSIVGFAQGYGLPLNLPSLARSGARPVGVKRAA